jgi:hypothetical protein
LAGVLGLLALLLVASTYVTSDGRPEADAQDRPAFYGTLVVAALALPAWWAAGFLATPVITAATMMANGARRPGQVAGVSVALAVVLYVVFFYLFQVPVPLGLLER